MTAIALGRGALLLERNWMVYRRTWMIIFSGLFERHPDLRVVFAEGG